MPLGSGGNLERLQLTIGFIAARFEALVGIIVIQVFTEVLSKAVLSVLLCNYLEGITCSTTHWRTLVTSRTQKPPKIRKTTP